MSSYAFVRLASPGEVKVCKSGDSCKGDSFIYENYVKETLDSTGDLCSHANNSALIGFMLEDVKRKYCKEGCYYGLVANGSISSFYQYTEGSLKYISRETYLAEMAMAAINPTAGDKPKVSKPHVGAGGRK